MSNVELLVNKVELLPCPFCGGKVDYHPASHHMENFWNKPTIYCPNCDYMIEAVSTLKLFKLWNNRKTIESIVEQLEDYRAAFDCHTCKYFHSGKASCDKDCTDALVDSLIDIVRKGSTDKLL